MRGEKQCNSRLWGQRPWAGGSESEIVESSEAVT
jgi:hypothetical protein